LEGNKKSPKERFFVKVNPVRDSEDKEKSKKEHISNGVNPAYV